MSGKFIQIAASGEYLYALDETGEVWWLDDRDESWEWKDIPEDRVRPEPPRRPNLLDGPVSGAASDLGFLRQPRYF